MKSKKTNLFTVVRVDSVVGRNDRGRRTVHLENTVLGTYTTKSEATAAFRDDFEAMKMAVPGDQPLCQSLKHRRMWTADFELGFRWHIVESGPVRLSPWDEDYDSPDKRGLLKINPGAKKYDVR